MFACALWLVVGRTIGSVEAIRRRAELITGRRLDERVPEPTTQDEIFRLARTLNGMLSRLERSAKRQERFVADAAHELRTPLTTLRTRLETAMLRGGGDGDPDPALLSELWSQTVRMGSLVDQLLLLARSDAGTLPHLDQPVDLEDVLHDVVTSTPSDGVSVRTGHVEPVQVRGNAALLELVVRNLVENAVRHATSTVDLSSSSDGTTAVLTVDDDGPGVAPTDRADVFHRFVRLDTSRDRSRGGVGLGLAIVAEIVRIHSGSVQVTDSPAGGARFTVRLPAGRPPAEHDAPAPQRVTSLR
ncbi:HAMP domain-containing histidine kinase [Nocardioides panacis]|uniref:histidine kinase n=1 Tax=Nocardioides panacis TaxID=2849501 RepID=A0A975SZ14_9ACTN|nr:HAMP domain-containing sensor histidine kinase [Nocardioides panacis]QWZ08025.1 HAMP domain-containing histidine kinase [Nocardioides panacis]